MIVAKKERERRALFLKYHLYNHEVNGKVVIDDDIKKRIDAYYEEYGA